MGSYNVNALEKNRRLTAVLFAHAYQLWINPELDGAHRHRPIKMTLGFPANCWIDIIKTGINGQKNTTQHTKDK